MTLAESISERFLVKMEYMTDSELTVTPSHKNLSTNYFFDEESWNQT